MEHDVVRIFQYFMRMRIIFPCARELAARCVTEGEVKEDFGLATLDVGFSGDFQRL